MSSGDKTSKKSKKSRDESEPKAFCHWCDKETKKPAYYSTKLINDYGLPVSFCDTCVPVLLEWDPKAEMFVD